MTNHIVVAYSVNRKAGQELSSGASIPDRQWQLPIPVPRVRAHLKNANILYRHRNRISTELHNKPVVQINEKISSFCI